MMIERLANKVGARLDKSFSLGSLVNLIGIAITLTGVVGGYYVLTYRVGQLEVVKARSDSDHDLLRDVAKDVSWIRSIVEKRSEVLQPAGAAATTPQPSTLAQQGCVRLSSNAISCPLGGPDRVE